MIRGICQSKKNCFCSKVVFMQHDDEDLPKRKKKGTGFWGWRALLILLLIGFALGAFLEHQYIEPLLGENAKKLASCESTNKLLNSEIDYCYKQLADANKNAACPLC